MPKNSPKQRRSRKKFYTLSLILLVVIVGLALGALYLYHKDHKSDVASDSSSNVTTKVTPADNNENNARKSSSSPAATLDNGPTAPTSNGSVIVQLNPVVSSTNVHVGTLVSGETSGSCSLTASQSGQSTLQLGSSSVKSDVNNYDCGVFNVPTSNFPSKGTWKLTLTVTNNGSSSSGTANITI